jgi:hypothetical protein
MRLTIEPWRACRPAVVDSFHLTCGRIHIRVRSRIRRGSATLFEMLDFFQAIAEIINSEKSYLSQLEIVEEFFMKPIQESGFLPQQVFAAIFGDILGIRYDKSMGWINC